MQRKERRVQAGGIIILRQIQPHEWIFELPRVTAEIQERFYAGADWMDADLKRAERIFRDLVREYPEHLDAHHHLALTLERVGQNTGARQIWREATTTALKFFPAHFSMERDHLQWGFLENRPFLRLYHAYGLELKAQGKNAEALRVFQNILNLNPYDNQGIRSLVVDCCFALNEPEGVLSVCKRFPDDAMEQLVFGRALALFQLGKTKEAGRALASAIKWYPLIAAEIVKPRHPKPKGVDEHDRSVIVGSQQQAFLYWTEQGKHWTATPGAIEFLRKQLSSKAPAKRAKTPKREHGSA